MENLHMQKAQKPAHTSELDNFLVSSQENEIRPAFWHKVFTLVNLAELKSDLIWLLCVV